MNLKPHEVQALRFLAHGPHRMGAIDSDGALAAFLVFNDLTKYGLATCVPGNFAGRGPEFVLTVDGVDALIEAEGVP